jgi:hypothetical protein
MGGWWNGPTQSDHSAHKARVQALGTTALFNPVFNRRRLDSVGLEEGQKQTTKLYDLVWMVL